MAESTSSTSATKPVPDTKASAASPNTTGANPTSIPAKTEPAKPASTTSTASGRSITTDAANDTDIPANAPATEAKIGTVSEALDNSVPREKAPEKDASEEKKSDTSKEQPILSLAALRDYHVKRGTAPTPEQVEEVRELENKILEEGGKRHRTNPEAK